MRPHRKSRAAPGPRLPGLPRLRLPGPSRLPAYGPRRPSTRDGPRRTPAPSPTTASRRPRLRRRPSLAAGAVAALALLSGTGPLRGFLDFTGGVLALVSLTAAVVWGLVAAGRTVLLPRSRLLAQGVHRALGTAALGFLVLHIAVKVAEGHAHVLNAVLPFTGTPAPDASALIGFGAVAGYLMVLAAATGALRSAFAGRGRASERWRALHACAYPAWCLALVHGLKSGRAPSGWVTTGYALCLTAVVAALLVRAFLPHVLRARLRARAAATPPPPPYLETASPPSYREAAPPPSSPEAAPLLPYPEAAPSLPYPEAAPSLPYPEATPLLPYPEAAPPPPSPEAAPPPYGRHALHPGPAQPARPVQPASHGRSRP
ncbi:hypothetical protein A6A06_08100 [Streptomyces sp. CB02923]|uniref:hypothetical protein n=1 Tax=Streptomyces sp. CB02923 TaxID=1718985 RepID=UPI00093DC70C|nr:hypothetical protein [Streptomyces sp. CB02923]OKI04700.1 hypothetical protein A6A06_08100 [Streptomyces sp. CB02923]